MRALRVSYWTSALLPIAATQRAVSKLRWRLRPQEEVKYAVSVPKAPLNRAMGRVMSAERRLLRRVDLPLGLSLFAILDLG